MKKEKKRFKSYINLPILLIILMLLSINLSITISRYSTQQEVQKFNLTIKARERLISSIKINSLIKGGQIYSQKNEDVTKIVFGYKSNYEEYVREVTPISLNNEIATVNLYRVINEDNKTYTVYILSDYVIYLPINSGNLFYKMEGLKEIIFENVNTTEITGMSGMFQGCSSLIKLDVTNFNTTNVTNMSNMFQGCSSLIKLDVTNFNTTNVTNMSYMFRECNSLIELDITNFDTTKVTNMSGMFQGCSSLIELDLTNFNTTKVTNMSNMFESMKNLVELNLSSFNTTSLTAFSYMFRNCSKLKTIYVSTLWNLRALTKVQIDVFENCNSLIGGNGMKYSSDKNSSEYAVIDNSEKNGYFTDITKKILISK